MSGSPGPEESGNFHVERRLSRAYFTAQTLKPFLKEHVYVGAGLYLGHNELHEEYTSYYYPPSHHQLTERSNLLVLQVPLGVMVHDDRIWFRMGCTLALAAFAQGEQQFRPDKPHWRKDRDTHYARFLLPHELVREGLLFQHYFLLRMGYSF